MATNREKITAVDLTTNTRRIGQFMWIEENLLQGKDHEGVLFSTAKKRDVAGDLPDDGPSPVPTESDIIAQAKLMREHIIEKTRNIETVLMKAERNFVESGFIGIGVEKSQIEVDTANAKLISKSNEVLINTAQSLEDLAVVVPAFEAFTPELNNPIRINDIPSVHNFCMLNDLFDAMSYELVNRNAHTGEYVFKSVDEIKGFIGTGRVEAARRLSLGNGFDVQNMKKTLDYIKQNLGSCVSFMDLAALSEYINSHVPKLILTRRWWAL